MILPNLENIWSRIAAVEKEEVAIAVLRDEIELAKLRLQPADTGHLHDYIARLNDRIDELMG